MTDSGKLFGELAGYQGLNELFARRNGSIEISNRRRALRKERTTSIAPRGEYIQFGELPYSYRKPRTRASPHSCYPQN